MRSALVIVAIWPAVVWGQQAPTIETIEIGARAGIAGGASSAGGLGVDGVLALFAALPLGATARWRIEAQVASSTVGPPWGDGVDAVEVSALDIGASLLLGAAPLVHRSGGSVLGVEVLLGPDVRATRVRTRVAQRSQTVTDVRLLARGAAGGFVQLDRLRLELRVGYAAPRGHGLEVMAGVGVRLP